ncbi:MAG: hypothetical protein M1814_004820 [Vezdaea aestivalis]|nr:MAG: hypothetical protein M1814_004820 [Vezdaea aestivalis]
MSKPSSPTPTSPTNHDHDPLRCRSQQTPSQQAQDALAQPSSSSTPSEDTPRLRQPMPASTGDPENAHGARDTAISRPRWVGNTSMDSEHSNTRQTGDGGLSSPQGTDSDKEVEDEEPDSSRFFQQRSSGRRGSKYDYTAVHDGQCEHGTLSPRPGTGNSSGASERAFGGTYPGTIDQGSGDATSTAREIMGDAVMDGILGAGNGKAKNKMSTTQRLASKHGVKNTRLMYLGYYVPFLTWIKQYRWSFLQGDLIAAITMASFYIPMALSYASNLGHIPPINGLYTFVFNPIVYALLGSCPQLVVGPEAAGSLLVGTVVKDSVDNGAIGDDDGDANARVAGVVTGISGAIILLAGISRLGFLDNVLSRPFLRGFISAIGFVIFVEQLIPEMGLSERQAKAGLSHGSSVQKIGFLVGNVKHAHGLTCAVSFTCFALIMIFRTIKKRLQSRFPKVAYVPDRFVVVVLAAVFSWRFRWDKLGLTILGTVKSSSGKSFAFRWPFQTAHMHHVRQAMSTSFLISLLGFFESSVAAKSLGLGDGKGKDAIHGMTLSANRELIALGAANVVGGCFMALPGFGGYGRSKVNSSTGGKTPMSSIFLSLITLICVLFLLPYFYYLPKGVLCAMISVVAFSLIEEAPHDIKFFWKIRGWSELGLMSIIFLATILYSLSLGIALGVGLSIISVIKHSTRPRIQILGRVPGTDRFENAEDNPDGVEFIDGCLIVKIPEPLTFANTGDLKNRLRRLELYGSTNAHPALPRVRAPEHNNNVIFDIHGVTGLDGSGTQVLTEIVQAYRDRGVRIFFCRVPKEISPVYRQLIISGIVDSCGGHRHFVRGVEEALHLTKLESLTEHFRDNPDDGAETPVLHFPISRRFGPFPTTQSVNLTYLLQELALAESRFNLTRREIKGNKVVRKAKPNGKGGADVEGGLIGCIGRNGSWFTKLKLAQPEQTVELDLDMLSSDLVISTTTSKLGSPFVDFVSQSYRKSAIPLISSSMRLSKDLEKGNNYPIPNCHVPTELFHAPTIDKTISIRFAHCSPPKSSQETLGPSGAVLGLASSDSLSQTKVDTLFQQLLGLKVIESSVWSILLINAESGVFSIGGSSAQAVSLIEQKLEEDLKKLGRAEMEPEPDLPIQAIEKRSPEGEAVSDWRSQWRWSNVQGADGWWQILMQGVWVDGAKVLKNQPVIIDFNTPFILAPPLATKQFYASISGSRPLPPPHNAFHVFPCLNPPVLAFEFGGWQFPAMRGGKGADVWSGPGGKFSLGRLRDGSGYCVGAVVETDMGAGDVGVSNGARGGKTGGEMAGNGLRDVWVIGETFWRGVAGVFDFKEGRVGMRTF